MTRWIRVAVAIGMLVGLSVPTLAQAQATIATTTLASAVGATDRQVTLASGSGISAGYLLYVDREAMNVTSISGSVAQVVRGAASTAGTAHVSGQVVYDGPGNYFYQNDVTGACTATSETATPHINVSSGNIFACTNGAWAQWVRAGLPAFEIAASSLQGATSYTASGAITNQTGMVFLNTTTLAMTLSDPTASQNGMVMTIMAGVGLAHTVTYSSHFSGATTTATIATFAAGVGNGFSVVAIDGKWWIIWSRNITFS